MVEILTTAQARCLHGRWDLDCVPAESSDSVDLRLLFLYSLFLHHCVQTDLRHLRTVHFVDI